MKKKTKIIIIVSVVLLLILIPAYLIYSSFSGSFIRRITMTNDVRSYVAKEFPGEEWEISFAVYDYKCSSYSCNVISPVSEDTHFSVYETADKELKDDYVSRVIDKENTICRIIRQIEDAVEERVAPVYPHRYSMLMGDFYRGEEFDPSDFSLDMEANLQALPHPAIFTFAVETSLDEPTWEEAAKLLREAVQITSDAGIKFDYFTIFVEYPYIEKDGSLVPTNYSTDIYAYDVPVSAILGDDLVEFLQKTQSIE